MLKLVKMIVFGFQMLGDSPHISIISWALFQISGKLIFSLLFRLHICLCWQAFVSRNPQSCGKLHTAVFYAGLATSPRRRTQAESLISACGVHWKMFYFLVLYFDVLKYLSNHQLPSFGSTTNSLEEFNSVLIAFNWYLCKTAIANAFQGTIITLCALPIISTRALQIQYRSWG